MENVFKINSKMYFLLMSKAIDDFTVAGLHDAYNQAGLASSCHQKDRKFLYRQIFKLEKKGLLDKSGEEYSRQIRYQKTALLHASSIQPLDAKKVENDFPSEEKTLPDIQELKSTMHEYQVKFVSSLGESEEYRRLFN